MKYILKILPIALLLAWSAKMMGQSDCQPLLVLMDDITMDNFYQAEVINSSATITSGTAVTFQAENNILLTDGFKTTDVAIFHGYIANCVLNDVEDLESINNSIKLFPNPANTITILEYELEEQIEVSISVINLLGQEVLHLVPRQAQSQGIHQISFDARQLPAEMYIFRIQLDDQVISRKFSVVQ